MIDENHHELLAQVASLYYEHEKSQNEIAKELGLSRVKIYRILKEAREEGVAKIVINWPIDRDSQLEENLSQVFHLKKAMVFKSTLQDGASSLQRLGQMTARYLEMILEDGMTLTVCLGRSTYEVINAVRPTFRSHINVAQAMGSIPFAIQELDSAALARQLAQKLGGQVLYLSSPLVATSPEAAAMLRSQPLIERTLNASRNADIALVGIGGLNPRNSRYVQADLITAQALIELEQEGAVGDIGGQFFTQSGGLYPCKYNQCMIGLSLEEMKQIPNTIAVAMGKDKVKAILGGLHTGVIDVLCTDHSTAREVLQLELSAPSPGSAPIST
ncbi:MAG TPA: sugar-binding transcriptional regulator [Anaerolineales bacterium]|nr:sugar-binding transcriptional regulator [Anaerolineales bacterium]